ncbi:MAG: Nif3-like dinuclear metal center hexameric protein [Clostridia bacterium]|nr:Nif3-like dinuclear metal center hexameric protein [Clostridia bacterium]
MKLTDILKILEEVAPVALSDEFCKKYGMYDNSGIIVDCKKDINGAVFSLDLSKNAIRSAKEKGYNLIITHHPAIYGGISRISADGLIAECLLSGISVISMHLNFDVAPRGIDYYLMCGLGGKDARILADISNGGYGRLYEIQPTVFNVLAEKVKIDFNTERALFYGNSNKQIRKIASFCGAGCDNKAIAFAKSGGADAFVSSDMKHHEISALLEMGINVIHLTHYSAENYGFNKIHTQISTAFSIPTDYFTDKELL